ncbi:MAG: hypothetical protein ACOYKD_06715 [Anaerolineaceae bacterium]
MQADTIVPTVQGTQAWDRFAYINNNPVNGTDPTGMWMCGDQYDKACIEAGDNPYIITIGGRGDGIYNSNFTPQFTTIENSYPGYLNKEARFLRYDIDSSSAEYKKQNTAQTVFNQIMNDPMWEFFNIYIIGHSAGADSSLLLGAMLSTADLDLNIKGIALLDTSLSAEPNYHADGSMGVLINDIIDSGTKLFVGLSNDYSFYKTYLDPSLENINQKDFRSNLNYSYYFYGNERHGSLYDSSMVVGNIWNWIK